MRGTGDDRVRLLHGPYRAPPLKVGDRATCLRRDCDVKVTGWTDARIPWTEGVPVGRRGAPSIVLEEELARAVRCESAAAIRFWWGVSVGVVWRWRKALGIGRADSEGSRRLIQAAAEKGAEAMRAKDWSPEERDRKRQIAVEQNLGRHLHAGYHGRQWTPEEITLLGKLPDAEVARRTGWKADAVRQKRERMGIPNAFARPGAYGGPRWTAEDNEQLRRLPPKEAAARLGRTLDAVYSRRCSLGLSSARRRPRP